MFDQIERLKREYTDKYVKVDSSVPELQRFDDFVGQVKTVNMSGRALVQFDAWNNIGWYDIDVAYLRVVPQPEAGAAGKEHAAKPAAAKPAAKVAPAPAAGEKKLSPLEMARAQGAAKGGAAKPAADKPVPAGDKKSTADILAASRAGKASAAPVAKPEASTAAKPSGGKMSTADILAAARAKKAAEASEPAPPAASAAPEPPKASVPPAPAAPSAMAEKPAATKPAFAPGQRPSVPEILAWCRQHDHK